MAERSRGTGQTLCSPSLLALKFRHSAVEDDPEAYTVHLRTLRGNELRSSKCHEVLAKFSESVQIPIEVFPEASSRGANPLRGALVRKKFGPFVKEE